MNKFDIGIKLYIMRKFLMRSCIGLMGKRMYLKH